MSASNNVLSKENLKNSGISFYEKAKSIDELRRFPGCNAHVVYLAEALLNFTNILTEEKYNGKDAVLFDAKTRWMIETEYINAIIGMNLSAIDLYDLRRVEPELFTKCNAQFDFALAIRDEAIVLNEQGEYRVQAFAELAFRDIIRAARAGESQRSQSPIQLLNWIWFDCQHTWTFGKAILQGSSPPTEYELTAPKLDGYLSLPSYKNDMLSGFHGMDPLFNFQMETLEELSKLGLKCNPRKNTMNANIDISRSCFPFTVIEVKKTFPTNAELQKGYCQIANGAATCLAILENLCQHGNPLQRQTVQPVVGFTFIGPQLKLWISHVSRESTNSKSNVAQQSEERLLYDIHCMLNLNLTRAWDCLQFVVILEHLQQWALQFYRPWVSNCITQWRHKNCNHTTGEVISAEKPPGLAPPGSDNSGGNKASISTSSPRIPQTPELKSVARPPQSEPAENLLVDFEDSQSSIESESLSDPFIRNADDDASERLGSEAHSVNDTSPSGSPRSARSKSFQNVQTSNKRKAPRDREAKEYRYRPIPPLDIEKSPSLVPRSSKSNSPAENGSSERGMRAPTTHKYNLRSKCPALGKYTHAGLKSCEFDDQYTEELSQGSDSLALEKPNSTSVVTPSKEIEPKGLLKRKFLEEASLIDQFDLDMAILSLPKKSSEKNYKPCAYGEFDLEQKRDEEYNSQSGSDDEDRTSVPDSHNQDSAPEFDDSITQEFSNLAIEGQELGDEQFSAESNTDDDDDEVISEQGVAAQSVQFDPLEDESSEYMSSSSDSEWLPSESNGDNDDSSENGGDSDINPDELGKELRGLREDVQCFRLHTFLSLNSSQEDASQANTYGTLRTEGFAEAYWRRQCRKLGRKRGPQR